MKQFLKKIQLCCFWCIGFFSIIAFSQDSDANQFLRDRLMVYYVEDPSSNQYRLLQTNEINSAENLFGNNPQMEVAQNLIRDIFTPAEDGSFQEDVAQALGSYTKPVALFLYYDQGPVDIEIASANWTNCIERGQFTSCVTVEADDEYAGIVHYGSNQMSQEGLLETKGHLLQLFNELAYGSQRSRPFAALSNNVIERARSTVHLPERGFRIQNRGRTVRFNIGLARLRELARTLQNPEILQHIQSTMRLFENDNGTAHLSRDEIDMPLILAIATRESGLRLPLARGERRLVSAGRDAHSRGESGLDFLYDHRNHFPSAIQSEIIRVKGNSAVQGHLIRENTNPAYIKEKHMLASFIVEIEVRKRRFLTRFERAFSDSNGFTAEQRQELLNTRNTGAIRAWTQAAFGSKLTELLNSIRQGIRSELRSGAEFSAIIQNDEFNLNAIVVNDNIMPTNLSRQRTRLSLAEAMIIASFLPNNL
ncbi:hypothetical protein [Spongiimicrobium salis]|uniref:hypothetical protein n=1 Tax=Spongiimicrobium salis TaxID=1667022 RepID=UPI00374D7D69